MCIHLYDLLDVPDLVHEFHLCHPPDVLELLDRPDHTTETETTAGIGTTREGTGTPFACALRATPFGVSVLVVVSVVAVSVVCDQVDQVVPAHQVDGIDEAHQVDPAHQVDHKEEFICSTMIIL